MLTLSFFRRAFFVAVFFAGGTSLLNLANLFFNKAQASELSISVGEAKSRYFFRGRGEISADGFRIAYIHHTPYKWNFSNQSFLRLELELGAHHWRDPWLDNNKSGVVVNPMWRYYYPIFKHQIYVGAGVGLAYTNDDTLLDRKLGARLLFEDKFEAGAIIADKHRISISINHYSNANLADINHGVNYTFLNYAYAF